MERGGQHVFGEISDTDGELPASCREPSESRAMDGDRSRSDAWQVESLQFRVADVNGMLNGWHGHGLAEER